MLEPQGQVGGRGLFRPCGYQQGLPSLGCFDPLGAHHYKR